MQNSFIELTDEKKINVLITRIFLWLTLVFIINFLLALPFTLFEVEKFEKILIFSFIGSACTLTPYILRELDIKPEIIKYYILIMSNILLCFIISSTAAYPVMVFLLPIVLSCLYYKRKATLIAVAIGVMSYIFSKYLYSRILHKRAYVAGNFELGMLSSVIQFVILCGLLILLALITENIIKTIKSDDRENNLLHEAESRMNGFVKKITVSFVTTGFVTKYTIITLCTIYIGLLRANPPINVDALYLFPLIFSCLYFDNRLSIYSFVLSIINIIVADYFHIIHRGAEGQLSILYYGTVATLLLEFLVVGLTVLLLVFRNNVLVKRWHTGNPERSKA